MAGGIFWLFGSNINLITWIISMLLLFGCSCFIIGLFGSQKLIDEMCLDNKTPLSREAEKEFRKVHKVE